MYNLIYADIPPAQREPLKQLLLAAGYQYDFDASDKECLFLEDKNALYGSLSYFLQGLNHAAFQGAVVVNFGYSKIVPLNEHYFAAVAPEHVAVGCQKFPHDIVLRLAKAINEIK